MANTNFRNLTEDSKVIFFLGFSEIVLSVFSQKEDQILAQEVIYKCWRWLEDKKI